MACWCGRFNSMTTQLRDNRAQIDEFTRNLQQAVQELERRRQLMETVLENIPAGVIYMDANGGVQRTNKALENMFAPGSKEFGSLEEIVGPEAHHSLQQLMRRALRMGVVTREMEVVVSDRVLHLAVTVSSLGPRRAKTGFVLVFDDLTEVLRAQKSAAWQEVARRIAHEIKESADADPAFGATHAAPPGASFRHDGCAGGFRTSTYRPGVLALDRTRSGDTLGAGQ